MNVYSDVNDIITNVVNLSVFKIDLEYRVINPMTAVLAIKYAFKKLLCSDIEINNV